ncbi:MAG: hypothetical protein KBB86_00095 [Candidatus Pacebacteria bacterium]|nr:hypothetical protein [Candidatus Paceibacterota bacterium]
MEEGKNIIDKKRENKVIDAKNNIKAGFYTLIIFAIVVAIWVYTNPFFNKPQIIIDSFQAQPETVAKVNTINQSFKTMWSDIAEGFSSLKK